MFNEGTLIHEQIIYVVDKSLKRIMTIRPLKLSSAVRLKECTFYCKMAT